MTTLYSNDFASGLGTGWTISDSWDNTSPAGWEHAVGNGSGTTYVKRSIAGATYAETVAYGDATSGDNWGNIKLRCTGPGFVYDGDGFGVLFRSWAFNGTRYQIFTVGGVLVPSSGLVTTGTFPHDVASAVKIGVYSPTNTQVYIYINDVQVLQATGCTAQTGTNVMLGVYNGNNSHFDYLTVADAFPSATVATPVAGRNVPLSRRRCRS